MDVGGTDSINGIGLRYFNDVVNESISQGSLRMFVNGELSDVTVQVGNENFSCHRFVLASVSEFFRAVFRNEASSDHVTLDSDHVSPRSFALLVDMLYKKLDGVVDTEIATDMLISAVFLQIQFLQRHCEEYLVRTMTPHTCPDLWQFAELYTLEIIEGGAKKMATTRLLEVSKSEAFDRLPLKFLLALLSSEDLVVTKEDHVAEGIIKWVTADKGEREKYLPVLLPFVTFINVSDSGIHDLRKPCSYIIHIQGYLDEALAYKLEGATKVNSLLRQEILARQERRVARNDVNSVLASIDTSSTLASLNTGADNNENPFTSLFYLSHLGAGFATCVWRNELYVSSDFVFKVYNSGAAKWTALPHLDQHRQGHAMVAVGRNIYLLGGKKSTNEDKYDETPKRETVDELGQDMSAEGEERVLINPTEAQVSGDELCPGVIATENRQTTALCEISVYCTETQTWKTFSRLLEPVTDVTAAVLGHRIYVFGGKNADGQPTSLVQCVNTLTATVYRAGSLPSPTSGARAVSDGNAIYVVVSEGIVYGMTENSLLADQREKHRLESHQTGDVSTPVIEETENGPVELTAITTEGQKRMAATFRETRQRLSLRTCRETNNCSDQTALHQSSVEGEPSLTQQDGAKGKEEAGDQRQYSSDENTATLLSVHPLTTKEDSPSTVSFKKLAVIPGRRHFGACLYKGELWVAGGQDAEGASLSDVIGVDLHTGTVTTKPQTLDVSPCSLHVINVPNRSDVVEHRFTFRPDDLVEEEDTINSKLFKINKFNWYLSVRRRNANLGIFLRKTSDVWSRFYRRWVVSAKWEIEILSAKTSAKQRQTEALCFGSTRHQPVLYKEMSSTFKEGTPQGDGNFVSMEALTEPANGCIDRNGEVTVRATVTITKPPWLEPEPSPSQPRTAVGFRFDQAASSAFPTAFLPSTTVCSGFASRP